MKKTLCYNPVTLRLGLVGLIFLIAIILPVLSHARRQPKALPEARDQKKQQTSAIPGEILVRFRTDCDAVKRGRSELSLNAGDRSIDLQIERLDLNEFVPGLRLGRVAEQDASVALKILNSRPDVLYAEPNYRRQKSAVPNDPRYSELWGLKNTGVLGGTAGADIKAEQAWDITTGSSSIVVAVIDEGIDINHADLQQNIWRNAGEIAGNSLDDDGNGFVDDINGYDFFHNDASVYDGPGTNPDGSGIDEHGTHVAGTLGAVGNNGTGVVGVNWQTSLMSLKFLGPTGGSSADLLRAFGYAKMMRDRFVTSGGTQGANVRITNNSYGGNAYSQAEADAIQSLSASGILVVAAAGNEGEDNNLVATYPASYDLSNVISVAATNRNDNLVNFSNRGSHSVHLGAPGSTILSTTPTNTYSSFSGTSMASPHVAGAAALVLAAHPDFSLARLRAAVIFGGDPVTSLDLTTITGRRVSAFGALQNGAEVDTTAPAQVSDFHVASQVGRSVTLNWTATGDDDHSGTAALAEIRFVDQSTGAKHFLDTLRPASAGTAEFANVRIPFRHTAGTLSLGVIDNAGNESNASLPISIPLDDADRYVITEGPAEPLSTGGIGIHANFDDVIFGRGLPFEFPFFDRTVSSVNLSTNGTIYFPPRIPNDDPFNSSSALSGWRMIAGLWDDLDLSLSRRSDADIYVVTPDSDRIIFRWQGVPCNVSLTTGQCTGGDPVNFEIELRRNGTIITRYGGGNHALHPVVGIGGGERDSYIVDSHTSEISPKDLTNAPTVTYTLRSQPRRPNLTLSTGGSPQPIRVGQNLQFNIQMGNSGSDPAGAVTLTEIFPADTTLVSCTTTQGFCKAPTTSSPNKFLASIGSIAPGGTATVTVVLNATTFPNGGSYSNTATVSSANESDKTSFAQIQAVRPNPNPLRGVTRIGAGFNQSYSVLNDGSLLGWGDGRNHELGFENFSGFKLVPTPIPALSSGVSAVDGGAAHGLALKTDGTVWSWGTNFNGQVGDGTTSPRDRPAALSGLANMVAVSAGAAHSLALRSDGTVWAWGANNRGQLGDTTTIERHSPVQVNGLSNVTTIAAGGDHSLAIRADGTVWAWGGNDHGQLGDGTTVSKAVPTQVSGLAGVMSINAGGAFTLALKSDGTVWSWGWNNFGQLGINISLFERPTPAQIAGLNGVTGLSCGNELGVALRSDGTVWQWGNYVPPNGSFNLDRSIPVQVIWVTGITSVAAGGRHVLALAQDGKVWSWGDNNFAQLGDASLGFTRWWPNEVNDLDRLPPPIGEVLMPSFTPDGGLFITPQAVQIRCPSADATVARIVYGVNHSVILMTDGTIWSSGRNDYGQLGNSTTTPSMVPVQTQISGTASVSDGGVHSLALKADGSLWAWGGNVNGQLGVSPQTEIRRPIPARVDPLTGVSKVSAGGSHTVALKTDGTVWAWGWNDQGQVGDGTQTDRYTPTQVQGLANVNAISAGIHHNLALKTDGTVWAWGDNRWGEIGDGTLEFRRLTPVQVVGLTNIVAVSAGAEYSSALRSDGTVWTWGDNQSGQLGIGQADGQKHPVPAQVTTLNSVVSISAGGYHAFARQADGTVWGWGANSSGQLGTGGPAVQSSPVPIGAVAGSTLVSGGYNSAFMLKTDGTAWVWGGNDFGMLGLGNTINRTAPVNLTQPSTGVTIHYTTNGADPIESDPVIGSGASVVVDHTLTLKARAFKNGWAASPIKNASFSVVPLNPIDDSRTFIRQHYLDFLNREPDLGGWDYWTGNITQCGTDLRCIHNRRIDVSAAFFIELEFQETGYVVYRIHRAAFGTWPGGPTRANLPFATFMTDRDQLVAGPGLPQSTINFANAFVQRPQFLVAYPANQTNAQFVNKLFDTAGLIPFTAERQQQINAMNNNGKTRAQVLLDVIEIPAFKTGEYNPAFVLMQYFGYLRRDPDQGGYDFWLDVLNNRVPGNFRGMVCAFLTSAEYQRRFGTAVTRTDRDCGP